MLTVRNLQAGYGRLQVLWDVNLEVSQGDFVALIGSNGAGKTTILRAIAGVIKPFSGEVNFQGKLLNNTPSHKISQTGISYITEELNLFEAMSVHDNLLLGAFPQRARKHTNRSLEKVFELFPVLSKRRGQLAGTLSGGERRMLALGRGLMSEPNLLMVDEPSLGLAPRLVLDVFEALKALHIQGVTVLLVEQNVNHTLKIANRAYVLEQGHIVLQGASQDLLQNDHLRQTYLGRR